MALDISAPLLLDPQHRPSPESLVTELLALEKAAKQQKKVFPMASLLGSWQLRFITGTKNKKARKQAGSLLGKGRYLPMWLSVAIAYDSDDLMDIAPEAWQQGNTRNTVAFGPLRLRVSGPIKYQAKARLLGFDFTHLCIFLGKMQIYRGTIRGGSDADSTFYETAIGKQAFFCYFYITPEVIAARGKGGGLALWTKIEAE